jgi:hypothetical protein
MPIGRRIVFGFPYTTSQVLEHISLPRRLSFIGGEVPIKYKRKRASATSLILPDRQIPHKHIHHGLHIVRTSTKGEALKGLSHLKENES